jgi:hypothetical protein
MHKGKLVHNHRNRRSRSPEYALNRYLLQKPTRVT